MVEYSRPVDYSMPRQCGMYPPPPYTYPKMRSMVALFQLDTEFKKNFLPPDFEALDLFDCVFIIEYPDSTIGPYNENLILLSVMYKNQPGLFVFNIYVDSDIALTAGREIWGYPKKMCKIELSPVEDNKVTGSLTRKGVKFLEVQIELSNRPTGLDVPKLIQSLPIYNVKLIPNVDGGATPALRQVTETILGFGEMYKNNGAKTIYINSEFSEFDICHEILKDSKKDLGGFYIECDMTLPPGRVLE